MSRQLVEPISDELPRLKMTYEEFLEWSGDTTHAEWVDGEVIVFMPPRRLHQRVIVFLSSLLDLFVRLRNLGFVEIAPFEMRLPDGSAREPDILFVRSEHGERLSEERLEGPADLVMEVTSDSTASYDRGAKFAAYERARVPEYWLVDPRPGRQALEPFTLSDDGRYRPIEADARGRYHSIVVPSFWLDPSWLHRDPPPDVDEVMMVIAPDAYVVRLRNLIAAYEADRDSSKNGEPPQR